MTLSRLRATLAEATRDLHLRLDMLAGGFGGRTADRGTDDRGTGGFGSDAPAPLAAYLRYLRASHSFRATVDPALARLASAGLMSGWQPPRLTPALAADLHDLAADATPAPPRLWPVPGTAAGVAGLVYVIEGSGLGARLLTRRAEGLGLGPRHGARHLAVQTADPLRWPRFLGWLEAGAFAPGPAADAACAAFALALACHEAAAATPLSPLPALPRLP